MRPTGNRRRSSRDGEIDGRVQQLHTHLVADRCDQNQVRQHLLDDWLDPVRSGLETRANCANQAKCKMLIRCREAAPC